MCSADGAHGAVLGGRQAAALQRQVFASHAPHASPRQQLSPQVDPSPALSSPSSLSVSFSSLLIPPNHTPLPPPPPLPRADAPPPSLRRPASAAASPSHMVRATPPPGALFSPPTRVTSLSASASSSTDRRYAPAYSLTSPNPPPSGYVIRRPSPGPNQSHGVSSAQHNTGKVINARPGPDSPIASRCMPRVRVVYRAL
eukprot:2085297-Rhodomonas_salina.1